MERPLTFQCGDVMVQLAYTIDDNDMLAIYEFKMESLQFVDYPSSKISHDR
jgi:hypothetical protein